MSFDQATQLVKKLDIDMTPEKLWPIFKYFSADARGGDPRLPIIRRTSQPTQPEKSQRFITEEKFVPFYKKIYIRQVSIQPQSNLIHSQNRPFGPPLLAPAPQGIVM